MTQNEKETLYNTLTSTDKEMLLLGLAILKERFDNIYNIFQEEIMKDSTNTFSEAVRNLIGYYNEQDSEDTMLHYQSGYIMDKFLRSTLSDLDSSTHDDIFYDYHRTL